MASDFGFSQDPHHMEAGLESPVDERVVLHSFSPLIKEASPSSEERREAVEMQDLAEEQDGDDQAFLSSSALVGRGRGRLGAKQVNPLVRARWSAATQRVLCSMPSRTIGRSQNAVISQCYNRSVRRLRRQSQPSIRDFSLSARPSIRGYRMEVTSEDEENTREQLVKNLQALSAGDRIRMLRAMPINMTEKSELRKLACSFKEKRPRSSTGISFFSRVKYYVIITLQHGWCSWLSFLQSLQLWQVAVKTIGGRFGTGVLSYFLFLKTLLLFNVFHFFVNGLFLVIPQAVNPPRPGAAEISFTGLELLTGGGYFTDTVMFYGYYTNSSLNETCQPSLKLTCAGAPDPAGCRGGDGATQMSYNIPAAYFFTTGAAFFVTCIILVYSMSKSFGQSFHIKKSRSNLTTKVFFSWDFKVIKKSSVKLQAENLCTQLKELLSEVNCRQVEKSQVQRLSWLAVHALAWTMCLASTLACACLVFFFLDEYHRPVNSRSPMSLNDEARLLALPALVSSINLLQPGFFNAVAWMEEYDSPSVRAYVAIFRNLLLKVSVLGVLCYHWLGKIAANSKSLGLTCWESYVGQELYRFLLMDFIFTILDTLFGEFLWKLFSQRVLRRQRKPVFDIARNVLELVYGQTLAWLGVLFSPLLPAVQIIKLLLLFYMKKTSLMMNCQAPRRPWRASQMTTFFISLLCFPSFLGAAVCVTYTIWMLKPSAECGPFRKLSTMAMSGKSWVAELVNAHPKLAWLCWVHSHLVENPIFLFVVAGIFLIVTYFHTQVVDGQRKIIVLLQEQIENEGQDKKFLISKLQMAHEEKRSTSSPRQELRSREDSCMD